MVLFTEDIANHGVILFGAQQYAYGRVVVRCSYFSIVKMHIHLHLAKVTMSQFSGFQVYYYIAFELDDRRQGPDRNGHHPGSTVSAFR